MKIKYSSTLINYGKKVLFGNDIHPSWKDRSDIVYLYGYSVRRTIVQPGKSNIIATNSIQRCKETNIPLFVTCLHNEAGEELLEEPLITTHPTKNATYTLKFLELHGKKLRGSNFFAFNTDDYRNNLDTAESVQFEEMDDAGVTISTVNTGITAAGSNVIWGGVLSFGERVQYDPRKKFTKKILGGVINIHQGFKSFRFLKAGGVYKKVLMAISSFNEVPSFQASIEPDITLSSNDPNTIVSDIFKTLGIEMQRKWSGWEFFGFMKQEVFNHLKTETSNIDVDRNNNTQTTTRSTNKNEVRGIAKKTRNERIVRFF